MKRSGGSRQCATASDDRRAAASRLGARGTIDQVADGHGDGGGWGRRRRRRHAEEAVRSSAARVLVAARHNNEQGTQSPG